MWYLLYSIIAFYALGVAAGTAYKFSYSEAPVRWSDVLNPLKWFSVAISAVLIHLVPVHILEQLVLRIYDDECGGICVARGHCHDCGCAMPMKAYDPYAECSKGNWGPMVMNAKKYKAFRKKYPVKIKVTYEQQ